MLLSCDFSEGLLGKWQSAMNSFVAWEFKIPSLPEHLRQSMYGYCMKHFNSNVIKVSQISKYVDPSKKAEFIGLAMSLPGIKTFSVFTKSIFAITNAFPDVTPWMCWYLHEKRRGIFFQACKNIDDTQLGQLKQLLRTTNGQEGLGGFLKNSGLAGERRKLIGNALFEHLASWTQMYEDELGVKGDGSPVEYKRWNRKDKKKFR